MQKSGEHNSSSSSSSRHKRMVREGRKAEQAAVAAAASHPSRRLHQAAGCSAVVIRSLAALQRVWDPPPHGTFDSVPVHRPLAQGA